MSLLKNDNMNNNNPKTPKKSRHQGNSIFAKRIDLFLILAILVIISGSVIINLVSKSEVKSKQVNLILSLRCEELLGKEMTEMLLQEYNEINPDIQIHLQEEDETPNILIFDEGEFCALIAVSALAELNFFYNQDILNDQASYEDGDDEYPIDNTQYLTSPLFAVPLVWFMDLLFYNIDILSAAGFSYPPRSRDEFLACIRSVSRRNIPGVSGTTLGLNPEDRQALSRDIFSWIWAAGGNFWPGDNNSPVSNARTLTSDLTFFGSVNRELQGNQNRAAIFERTGNQQIDEFAQGQIALMVASTRVIPYLRERMGDNAFGITTIPDPGTGGRYNIGVSSIYAGINSGDSPLDEASMQAAWHFLKFIAEKSSLFCAELKAIPGSISDLIPGEYVRDDPFYSKAWDIFEASRIVQNFSGKPGALEYEAVFLEELRNFFTGSRTAMQAAAAIQRRWDEVQVPDFKY